MATLDIPPGAGFDRAAADGLQSGGAVTGLDRFPQVLAAHLSGDNVVRQNLSECVLVFRLEQSVNGTGRELGKGFVRWRENG
jgi:hypothetical protein